ncbi:hypothetical protein AX769_14095 [Frondihabitans sp. PAMC 28766]|uniref:hypothetical protein n=1 Tax=Frondihabitans sp. PAMC 28766 TaxID=1795630 RepID=UPI00078DA59C|nr:hypothetical protein [Frondihabitans sp. PAMC 28766]AMM21060.1 hypothetical protein AX769_14095 [Frondihabitans sp. PAMC 28766]
MTTEPTGTPQAPVFTMLGAADAVVCEGDSCVVPGAGAGGDAEIDIEPSPDEAAAASARAVTAALDEGASL